MRRADGMHDDARKQQQQRGDAAGEQIGGGYPALRRMHRLVAVLRDDNGKVAVSDPVEAVHAFDAVQRGAADPDGIRVRLAWP